MCLSLSACIWKILIISPAIGAELNEAQGSQRHPESRSENSSELHADYLQRAGNTVFNCASYASAERLLPSPHFVAHLHQGGLGSSVVDLRRW